MNISELRAIQQRALTLPWYDVENGEFIAAFGPDTVGKILDFVEAFDAQDNQMLESGIDSDGKWAKLYYKAAYARKALETP